MRITDELKNAGLIPEFNSELKYYTTIKVGGKTDILVKVKNSEQLYRALMIAHKFNFPRLVIGKGSNIVISDKGFRGMTIINNAVNFRLLPNNGESFTPNKLQARFDNTKKSKTNIESDSVIVEVESGVRIQYLMNKLFDENITGLEYFAGIPCTIGGAIYMNLHGGNKFIAEYLLEAELFSKGKKNIVKNDYFRFDYDYSVLHQTKESVLKAKLMLPRGNGSEAKEKASEWAKAKSIQPKDSAGCVFKNLTEEQRLTAKLPSLSIGYIIDKILGMKGFTIGGARISPNHAAFIENTGNAAARDIYQLHLLIKDKVKEKLGIELENEIEFIGEF